jgi:hypothetical protein
MRFSDHVQPVAASGSVVTSAVFNGVFIVTQKGKSQVIVEIIASYSQVRVCSTVVSGSVLTSAAFNDVSGVT